MARLLVAGPTHSLAGQQLLEATRQQLAQHETQAPGDITSAADIRALDGAVAWLDGRDAETAALVALCQSERKPVLGLYLEGGTIPKSLSLACKAVAVADEASAWSAIAAFEEELRPHAGRLVRDLVPRLVAEAGHQLSFRSLAADERPGHLKRKILEEARALEAADPASEKEEVADVLEALEAFLAARGFDRDALRATKDAKRRRRGAFERCYVVEATGPAAAPAEPPAVDGPSLPPQDEAPEDEDEAIPDPPLAPDEAAPSEKEHEAPQPAEAEDAGFEYPAEQVRPAERVQE